MPVSRNVYQLKTTSIEFKITTGEENLSPVFAVAIALNETTRVNTAGLYPSKTS